MLIVLNHPIIYLFCLNVKILIYIKTQKILFPYNQRTETFSRILVILEEQKRSSGFWFSYFSKVAAMISFPLPFIISNVEKIIKSQLQLN